MKPTCTLLLVTLLIVNIALYAQEKTWTGSQDSNWNNPNNWNPPAVPGARDKVRIPEGSPACQLPNTTVTVNRIYNYGTLQTNNAHLSVNSFNNNGKVTIGNNLFITERPDGINGHGVSNEGIIEGRNPNTLFFVARNETKKYSSFGFSNMGGIGVSNAYYNVTDWSSNFFIKGNSIFINSTGDVSNFSLLAGYDDPAIATSGYTPKGGSIWINAERIYNTVNIEGGHAESGNGGSVFIKGRLTNNGSIISGNGGERDGEVYLDGNNIVNRGKIAAGSSPGGLAKNSSTQQQAYFGNVTLVADTIVIQPSDTSFIEADTLRLIGNSIQLSDFKNYATIYVDSRIEINTPPAGVVDLSGIHTQGAISGGGNFKSVIQSNQILAPSEGLNFIFDLPPVLLPSDTTIIGLAVTIKSEYANAGENGLKHVVIQNQSMTDKAIAYSISSQKGWLNTVDGTTPFLNFLESDTLNVAFAIPPDEALGSTDTVKVAVSIGTFSYQATAIIASTGPSATPTGIEQHHQNARPNIFKFYANYPNPFNPVTWIQFDLDQTERVKLNIYDIIGRKIDT
ncbi:MAG: hypothetical protein JXB29_02575, partial [Sedimentisphaerales bacterium]|nr:hypothetical protein [Sedimentisphaerales bacterium]